MRPEDFDVLIIGNIIVGLILAGRRLVKDLRAPLSDDVPGETGEG